MNDKNGYIILILIRKKFEEQKPARKDTKVVKHRTRTFNSYLPAIPYCFQTFIFIFSY